MKVTKEEIKTLKGMQAQRDGLRKLLGDLQLDETRIWRTLEKKYKLDLQQYNYTINFETGDITLKKVQKSSILMPGMN